MFRVDMVGFGNGCLPYDLYGLLLKWEGMLVRRRPKTKPGGKDTSRDDGINCANRDGPPSSTYSQELLAWPPAIPLDT